MQDIRQPAVRCVLNVGPDSSCRQLCVPECKCQAACHTQAVSEVRPRCRTIPLRWLIPAKQEEHDKDNGTAPEASKSVSQRAEEAVRDARVKLLKVRPGGGPLPHPLLQRLVERLWKRSAVLHHGQCEHSRIALLGGHWTMKAVLMRHRMCLVPDSDMMPDSDMFASRLLGLPPGMQSRPAV